MFGPADSAAIPIFSGGEGGTVGAHPYQSLLPLSEDGSLKVSISNLEEVDVNISRISTCDELKVKVEEFGGRPMKVEVE